MQKNNIILVLALGLIVSPTAFIQAVENVNTGVNPKIDYRATLPGVNPGVPSPAPIRKDIRMVTPEEHDRINGITRPLMDSPRAEMDARVILSPQEVLDRSEKRMETLRENRVKIQEDAPVRWKEIVRKIEDNTQGEVKVKLEAKAKDRVKKVLENIFQRLNGQIEKLAKLDAKIAEKVSTLEKSGVNVTLISAQYVLAQTSLEKAKVDVNATKLISIDQTNTATTKEALRALVKTAEDSIKAAGNDYRKIIPLLPDMGVDTQVETKTDTRVDTGTTSSSTDVQQ